MPARMSNELEHARKSRIVKGSRLDELFDPSLRFSIDPILKPYSMGSKSKTVLYDTYYINFSNSIMVKSLIAYF